MKGSQTTASFIPHPSSLIPASESSRFRPVRLHPRRQQHRTLDGHLELLDLVLVLTQRLRALARGLTSGGGDRLRDLLALDLLGGLVAHERRRGHVAQHDTYALGDFA